jgi:hypothetical protein
LEHSHPANTFNTTTNPILIIAPFARCCTATINNSASNKMPVVHTLAECKTATTYFLSIDHLICFHEEENVCHAHVWRKPARVNQRTSVLDTHDCKQRSFQQIVSTEQWSQLFQVVIQRPRNKK